MMKKEDAELISALQSWYASGVPNGWLLGWDHERFGADLKSVLGNRRICNVTSFDYSRCNSYQVECSDGAGRALVLAIRISFVQDLFALHWTRYAPDRSSGEVVQAVPSDCAAVEESVVGFLMGSGLRPVPDHLYDQHVPNVELELSDPSDVTVGKCLFDDYDG